MRKLLALALMLCLLAPAAPAEEDYTVDIYRMEGLRSMIAYNGVPSYMIRTSCLDTLVENMRIFDETDKEFALTWQ